MATTAASHKLATALDQAAALRGEGGVIDSAECTVKSVLSSWPKDQGLYAQLQRLSDFINETRSEISALNPSEVKGEFIPSATDELDAIVEATATATNKIMDNVEILSDLISALPEESSSKGMDAVMAIYEACTFQDITGQRITKVVGLLKVIESRVTAMSGQTAATPERDEQHSGATPKSESSQGDIDALFSDDASSVSDEDLLNGPALPGQGTSQAEIDALFD